jgi:hypothetical protein
VKGLSGYEHGEVRSGTRWVGGAADRDGAG